MELAKDAGKDAHYLALRPGRYENTSDSTAPVTRIRVSGVIVFTSVRFQEYRLVNCVGDVVHTSAGLRNC